MRLIQYSAGWLIPPLLEEDVTLLVTTVRVSRQLAASNTLPPFLDDYVPNRDSAIGCGLWCSPRAWRLRRLRRLQHRRRTTIEHF
jgi:hypothetical protein